MTTTDQTTMKTYEKWAFAAHFLFAAGTLCITISQLVQIASEGRITEITPRESKQTFKTNNDYSATDYFRR